MHTYLSGYCDLGQRLVADWTSCAVGVVKDYGDTGFGDARLATLVDEILLVLGTHLLELCEHTLGYDGPRRCGRIVDVGLYRTGTPSSGRKARKPSTTLATSTHRRHVGQSEHKADRV